MKAFKTYQEFESFVPKNVEGRAEEFQKMKEEKIRPFLPMLNKMFDEIKLSLKTIDDVDSKVTPSNRSVITIKMNREQIGQTHYEEFLKVTITDASTKALKKFRINVTKEMNNFKTYTPNHLDANLATFEFAEDGTILNGRLNG